jgi:hypothetical protein
MSDDSSLWIETNDGGRVLPAATQFMPGKAYFTAHSSRVVLVCSVGFSTRNRNRPRKRRSVIVIADGEVVTLARGLKCGEPDLPGVGTWFEVKR